MERVNEILNHGEFTDRLAQIDKEEEDRMFCRHGLEHLLDVARLAYIYNLECRGQVDKELIYAAALLHDIGRSGSSASHHVESAAAAEGILLDCGFSGEERRAVCSAIMCHRDRQVKDEKTLRGFLYKADKQSRCCFYCKSAEACNWEPEKRNLRLQE